jgi:hypothetical protein
VDYAEAARNNLITSRTLSDLHENSVGFHGRGINRGVSRFPLI